MKRNTWLLISFFSLLLYHTATAQSIQYERSYVNITKGTTGGTIEPGDLLELRATMVVFSGTTISRCTFSDILPTGTTYVASSMKIQTNEGVVVQSLTDVGGDDAGTQTGSSIAMNIGTGATSAVGGTITGGTTTPRFSGTSIIVAAYRVTVAVGYNTDIPLKGNFIYKVGTGVVNTFNFTPITLRTYTNLAACLDSRGSSAVLDNNGTFGSGTIQNRGASPAIPAGYVYQALSTNQPNDGFYSVVNNTSPTGATNPALPKPGSARVFTVFDIIGDHTGAAIPSAGNLPVAPGVNGGYMVLINASYRTDAAINQPVSNLCPNTYYDFSAWFRNICSLCGADANSVGTNTPGVKPNLSFEVNGKAYYTSGEIAYTNTWVRKGFVYKTGPAETALTITVRNNAPGGGGNDWVMDDVSFSICLPRIQFTAVPYYTVCVNNQVDITATIRSYYNNYTEYVWEKSIDNGVTWINTGITGSGTPVFVAGQYEYTINYPSFIGTMADNGTKFRIRVATSTINLADANCSYVDVAQISILQVKNCGVILPINLQQFTAEKQSSSNLLQWAASNETSTTQYEIERSINGTNFSKIGMKPVAARQIGNNYYQWLDETTLAGVNYYYRLKMVNPNANAQYSEMVLVESIPSKVFKLHAINNPFVDKLTISCTAAIKGDVTITLLDMNGAIAKQNTASLKGGYNIISFNHLEALPAGTYVLKITYANEIVRKKIIKYK
jgi:uncharacterized repeat protein (TIGR01451 family)